MHPCLYFCLLYCICCVIYVDVYIVSLASPYPLRCYCAIAEGNTEGRGWLARLTSIANVIQLSTHSVFYMLEACVAYCRNELIIETKVHLQTSINV